MSSSNNNYSQYYQGDNPILSKQLSSRSGYRNKYENPFPQNNFPANKSPYQKQENYPAINPINRNPAKKSLAQEYLRQNQSKFEFSEDSDEFQDDPQDEKDPYAHKPSSPVLSIDSHRQIVQQSKRQQIYDLRMKIMSLQNEYLVDKKQLIDKYEKQIFDLNKTKSFIQDDKLKLSKQVQALKRKIESLNEENQQLREQLQVFVGENRKTPNFNSKDFGDVDLIIMNANKDEKIRELEKQLSSINNQKEQIENSLSRNKADRSSGQSFGHKNSIAHSFGQMQENLRSSLKQSSKINQNLMQQLEQIKKQFEQDQQRLTKLTLQNVALEAEKQAKSKEISGLNERLIKAEGRVYILQKQQENYSKKIKISEDLLEIRDKELRKTRQSFENQEQKMRRMIKEFEKSEKDWTVKNNKLEVEKTLTVNEKIDVMKREENKLLSRIESLLDQNEALLNESKIIQSQNKTLLSENKSIQSQIKSLQSQNKSLQSQIKSISTDNKSISGQNKFLLAQIKRLQGESKSLLSQNKKLHESLDILSLRQATQKSEMLKCQNQKQQAIKKSQQATKNVFKLKSLCKVQEQRIIELEKILQSVRQEKNGLRQQAQKIMRKQKSEIQTLNKSLTLMNQKQQKIQSQTQLQSSLVSQITNQNDHLSQQVSSMTQHIKQLSDSNESLTKSITSYEKDIIEMKRQNYQLLKQKQSFEWIVESIKEQLQRKNGLNQRLNAQVEKLRQEVKGLHAQVERLKNGLSSLRQHSQSSRKSQQAQKQQQQQKPSLSRIQEAYVQLKSQSARLNQELSSLKSKLDSQKSQKQRLIKDLTSLQSRYNQDYNRYQQISQQKKRYMQQAQNLTSVCRQMSEEIQQMRSQGQAPQLNIENAEQLEQLQKENQYLKKQLYRISSDFQTLKAQHKAGMTNRQSIKSFNSSQRGKKYQSPTKQNDCSSSLEASAHDINPLQSAIQIMKIQKSQMKQTINMQNQKIHQLQNKLQEAFLDIHNLKQNIESEEYLKNQQMMQVIHEKNQEILEGKIMQVNQVILEKEQLIMQITQRNQEIIKQFREFEEDQSEYINKVILEMNMMKEQKKEVHEELDQANGQLIRMEREKSKDRAELMSHLKQQVEHKLQFINDETEKLKQQIKRMKNQKCEIEKNHQLQIECRQQLYCKQRAKLVQEIEKLGKELLESQEKARKANLMIGEEKTLQSEISRRNEKIQMEYFEIKDQCGFMANQLQELNHKNQNLTIYCEETERRHELIINQLHHQIESLIGQNEELNQNVDSLKLKVDQLQTENISLLLQLQQSQQLLPQKNKPYQKQLQSSRVQIQRPSSRDFGLSAARTPPSSDRKQHPPKTNQDFIMIQNIQNLKNNQTYLKSDENQLIPQPKPQILDLYGSSPATNTSISYQNAQNKYPGQDTTFSRPKNIYQASYHTVKTPSSYFAPYKARNQSIRNEKIQYYRI